MSSHNEYLPFKTRNWFFLGNRNKHRWHGLPGTRTFLSQRPHSHVSLNYCCCGRTSRSTGTSMASVRQMYTVISCLSCSIYNWSRQITYKGQREMWSRQSHTETHVAVGGLAQRHVFYSIRDLKIWCFLTKVNENMKLNICEQAKMGKNNQLHLCPIIFLQHLVIFCFNQAFFFL